MGAKLIAVIERKVKFHGFVKDPQQFLLQSDISSRYEGSPNVLLEAMACGLPAICFNCPGGEAKAIVRNNVDGLLVAPEDVNALATAMDRLMSDDAERMRIGTNALEVKERFATGRIVSMWDEIIGYVTRRVEFYSSM